MHWHCVWALGEAVVVREIGVVTAAHVCQKGFLHDVITSIIGFLGGENKQYSDLMNEATQAAVKKLQQVASVRCRVKLACRLVAWICSRCCRRCWVALRFE